MQHFSVNSPLSGTDFSDLILENMVERIVAFDAGYRVLQVNKAFARWMGGTAESMTGRLLFDLLPELDNTDRKAVLATVLAGNTHFSNERYRGEPGFFEWRAAPLRDAEQQIIGGLCLLRDLTPVISQFNEIGKLQSELHEKNVLLESRARIAEAILDHSQDYIAVLDTTLTYRAVNKAFLGYSGKTSEEMIGRHVLEVFPWIGQTGYYKAIQEALEGKRAEYRNIPFSMKGGWANAFIIPLSFGDGLVYGVMLMTHEITDLVEARKQQEAANDELRQHLDNTLAERNMLTTIFNTTRDLVVVFDRSYRVLEANSTFLQYLGTERAALIGKTIQDVYGPSLETSDIFKKLQRCWEGETVVVERYPFIQNAGCGRLTLTPLTDGEGTVTHIMSVTQDLTELFSKNEKLERANRDLEQRARELDAIVYAASHELRSPVRKIRYFSSALADGAPSDPALFLEKISRNAEQLDAIVQALAQYQHELPQEAVSPFDPAPVFHAVAARLGLASHIHCPARLPVIHGYAGQVEVLFEELLTNALKFRSPHRPLSVQVLAEHIAAEGGAGTVMLTVTDNGSGFNPVYNERVCDLFFRAHDSAIPGHGLGLALCRRIMHAHDGAISVSGRADAGTTVSVHFPAGAVAGKG